MIADSSALAALFLREKGYQEIAKLFRAERVFTLDLAIKETLNAVWRRCRLGLLKEPETLKLAGSVERAIEGRVFELVEQRPLYRDALELALQHGITLYDALFITLARYRKDRLVTRDSIQAKVSKNLDVYVIKV